MLKYISGTAGALCGIAQGIYIVFKEAGSTPDSAIIVNDELDVAPTVQQDVVPDAASSETSLNSAPEGPAASSEQDASTSAATGEVVETEEAAPRAWLPAPEQVIGNSNKDAERSAFAQKIKEVWPARCQPDNEQYIRSLKAKLEAALQKVKDLENDKSNLSSALSEETTKNLSLKKDLDMVRDVLRERTNSSEERPAAESPAARAPASEKTWTQFSAQTDSGPKTKNQASVRPLAQKPSGQENAAQRSAGTKNGAAWRPPRPRTTAVPATPVAAAPKMSKPAPRRKWSWADEADLSPEEQAAMLDKYLRENPDPFAKK